MSPLGPGLGPVALVAPAAWPRLSTAGNLFHSPVGLPDYVPLPPASSERRLRSGAFDDSFGPFMEQAQGMDLPLNECPDSDWSAPCSPIRPIGGALNAAAGQN